MSTSGRTCRCGHGRQHPMVTAETEYGVLGWIRLIIGGTPTPTAVRWRCRECNQVFDQTTERQELEQHL